MTLTKRERHLLRLFLAVRREHLGLKIPFKHAASHPTTVTCIKQFAKMLDQYQSRGLDLSPEYFIRAQVELYGKNTYPQHLVSSSAFAIYADWRSRHFQTVEEEPTPAEKSELATYLAQMRNTTPADIVKTMPQLFGNWSYT